MNRRQFLKTGSLVVAGSAWLPLAMKAVASPEVKALFTHGVASGEPQADSVLLWTRVAPSTGGRQVNWQLAQSPDFSDILAQGKVFTNEERDYTLKVDVEALSPATTYYYRFQCDGVSSEIGRTRTLPQGATEQMRFAVISCSNYPFGFFNGYDAIARDSKLDFVLHLGDYIYEYSREGYGGETGKRIGREHNPPHEIITLDDYRTRHAQYKADLASRLMHAAHPMIPIWDDHESANNPWVGGAENHQPNEGAWSDRRNASLQAYYEWMPVREPQPGRAKRELWRHFPLGDLANLITLETRHTARSKQIDYADHLAGIQSAEQREKFLAEVLGNPDRNMISKEMELFYQRASKSHSNATWHFVGNQIPMARTNVPVVDPLLDKAEQQRGASLGEYANSFRRLGQLDLPIYLDTWDGYPAARERFYEMNKGLGRKDLIVLTGDSHSFWFNDLHAGDGASMGVEIGTTGITSPGDFQDYGTELATQMDRLLEQHNPEVLWTDGITRGYVVVEVSHQTVTARYLGVSTILKPEYQLRTVQTVKLTKLGSKLGYKFLA